MAFHPTTDPAVDDLSAKMFILGRQISYNSLPNMHKYILTYMHPYAFTHVQIHTAYMPIDTCLEGSIIIHAAIWCIYMHGCHTSIPH